MNKCSIYKHFRTIFAYVSAAILIFITLIFLMFNYVNYILYIFCLPIIKASNYNTNIYFISTHITEIIEVEFRVVTELTLYFIFIFFMQYVTFSIFSNKTLFIRIYMYFIFLLIFSFIYIYAMFMPFIIKLFIYPIVQKSFFFPIILEINIYGYINFLMLVFNKLLFFFSFFFCFLLFVLLKSFNLYFVFFLRNYFCIFVFLIILYLIPPNIYIHSLLAFPIILLYEFFLMFYFFYNKKI